MKECREKLRSNSGIALIFIVLIGAIAAVSLSILYLGYQQHLKHARRLFDEVTVTTAERVAKETYILDIRTGGVTYYYDGIHRSVTDSARYDGKVDLEGYGMSYASENRNAETGAVGIPNKGEDGGAQFLAVSVESDGTIHSRWQGPWLTAEDYELMTPEERERLTQAQLKQIDGSLIYENANHKMTEAGSAGETESEGSQISDTESESGRQEQTEPLAE